ncbi:hypothetical protein JAAARDRAFT_198638 [Jaapia argillacea MUCL 33604]|uniref:Uncharacterized protein n=1 Tax=Jaapia argillacea MUCL 33604 TaxID=933084 RepID=A0A067PLV7_9AGAM|nr:hypothetical protein JAAARDRAFT_198638 [Jaapia argillacea MUCL 33604]
MSFRCTCADLDACTCPRTNSPPYHASYKDDFSHWGLGWPSHQPQYSPSPSTPTPSSGALQQSPSNHLPFGYPTTGQHTQHYGYPLHHPTPRHILPPVQHSISSLASAPYYYPHQLPPHLATTTPQTQQQPLTDQTGQIVNSGRKRKAVDSAPGEGDLRLAKQRRQTTRRRGPKPGKRLVTAPIVGVGPGTPVVPAVRVAPDSSNVVASGASESSRLYESLVRKAPHESSVVVTDVWRFVRPLDAKEKPSISPATTSPCRKKPSAEFVGCTLCKYP